MLNKHDIQKDFYSRMTEFKKKYKDNDLGKTSEKKQDLNQNIFDNNLSIERQEVEER